MKDFKFDKRAVSYDEGFEGKASEKFYSLLLREAELKPGDVVLDVGCGTGALLERFVNAYGVTGFGVDVEEAMIMQARIKRPGMRFDLASCSQLPFQDQTFDAVISCMAYHHFDDKEGFARETTRVLKLGGVLYIADPNFPWIVRKAINGIARAVRVTGEFLAAQELESRFAAFGFTCIGTATDGYAQVVKLKKENIL